MVSSLTMADLGLSAFCGLTKKLYGCPNRLSMRIAQTFSTNACLSPRGKGWRSIRNDFCVFAFRLWVELFVIHRPYNNPITKRYAALLRMHRMHRMHSLLKMMQISRFAQFRGLLKIEKSFNTKNAKLRHEGHKVLIPHDFFVFSVSSL